MPMGKLALNEGALLELLNWELRAYQETAGCHFTSVRPVPAGGEANWMDAQLEADHAMNPVERFIAGQVVSETRRVYDLM
jgi:hypothetical protein